MTLAKNKRLTEWVRVIGETLMGSDWKCLSSKVFHNLLVCDGHYAVVLQFYFYFFAVYNRFNYIKVHCFR